MFSFDDKTKKPVTKIPADVTFTANTTLLRLGLHLHCQQKQRHPVLDHFHEVVQHSTAPHEVLLHSQQKWCCAVLCRAGPPFCASVNAVYVFEAKSGSSISPDCCGALGCAHNGSHHAIQICPNAVWPTKRGPDISALHGPVMASHFPIATLMTCSSQVRTLRIIRTIFVW